MNKTIVTLALLVALFAGSTAALASRKAENIAWHSFVAQIENPNWNNYVYKVEQEKETCYISNLFYTSNGSVRPGNTSISCVKK